MLTLTGSSKARTATLCALYFAQGIPWGFVTITLLSYIASRGVGLEETAKITALATLPWSFKIFWGVVIDRFSYRPMGHRRPWVLLAQLGIGATALAMILIDDLSREVGTLAWMVFVHNCFVSLQDVASDALAVDVLEDDERGRVNGMMWASNFAGTAVGGAGMGLVLASFGVRAAFALEVMVLFGIVLFPLLIREREGDRLLPWSKDDAARPREDDRGIGFVALVRALLRALWSRAAGIGLVFAAVSSLMIGMLVTVNPVFFVQELGWSQDRFSAMTGGVGSAFGVAGALVGGFLVDRMGVRLLFTGAGIAIAAICLGLATSQGLRASELYCTGYLFAVLFLSSAQTVAGFSLFMRLSAVAIAGTQFTLYMAVTNLGRVFAANLVGWLEDTGYPAIFGVMGGSMLLAIAVVFAIPERPSGSADEPSS